MDISKKHPQRIEAFPLKHLLNSSVKDVTDSKANDGCCEKPGQEAVKQVKEKVELSRLLSLVPLQSFSRLFLYKARQTFG